MAFDFKKEYKKFYMPKNKPEIVIVTMFGNQFLSQKNIYDKLRKQIVFCREQINIMMIYIYAEKSNILFSQSSRAN